MEPNNRLYEFRWEDMVISGELGELRKRAEELKDYWVIFECKSSSMKKSRFITVRDEHEIRNMFDSEIPIRNIAKRFGLSQYKTRRIINATKTKTA